ncbi:hypothetical protein [Winogradskyella ludwigii]|uniref:hypothetical protein n=1 Tax=Winogradskyella ludwigii TaxID=2686076 RepID=UPI0015C6A5CD|nr:hypothetical protein [Winogradskyella ludwigii]
MLILLAFSCGQNSSEKDLTGDWREIESEFSTWHFYPDSLILKFPGEWDEKTEWKANNSQIEFELPTFFWDSLGTPRDTINKILISYELSDNKDSLFGTLNNNWSEHKFSLLRTKSYIDYLKKKFGIQFTLPNDSSGIYMGSTSFSTIGGYKLHPIYGLKIFMKSSKSGVIVKTELSENLNNLEFDIKRFKDNIKHWDEPPIGTNEMYLDERLHLRVFADKSIPDSIITNKLKVTINQNSNEFNKHYSDTLPIRIYRILKSQGIEPRNIKGKEIKTIANTVYN